MEQQAFKRRANQAFLGAAPAKRSDRVAAALFIAVSVLVLAAVIPFAHLHLPVQLAFIPAFESALGLCNLMTAVLLLGQFRRSASPAILALGTAYLVNTMVIVPHLMAFPGLFAPLGLLGGNVQGIGWLYLFWHTTFPLFVLIHAVLTRLETTRGWLVPQPSLAIVAAVGTALCVTAAAVAVGSHPPAFLPLIFVNGRYAPIVYLVISPALAVFTLAILILVWRNPRGSVLDLWLAVVLGAWLCDLILSTVMSGSRFDLSWYAGRMFSLAQGAFILTGLLLDLRRLYDRLDDALEDSRAQNEALMRSREELMRAQRMEAVGQLTGGIAHDFNNILTAITGCLELIAKRPDDPARVTRLAQNASSAAERGAQLIRQLLTFSRRQSLRPQVLNPNDILGELHTLAAKALGESVVLSLNLAKDLDRICVDAGEFQACILNLVSNARDAMPRGGALRIQTRNIYIDRPPPAESGAGGAYVLVAVSDSGEGMDQATLGRVFEPFFTTKAVGRGTGLGLSQVYGFVHSAEGFVTIDSAPGKGTTVSLYFPRTLEAPAPMEKPAPARLPGAENTRVLVVEDDADVMATTAELLRDSGFDVVTAANGDEALARLKADAGITVLFSDLVMPGGITGVQLAEEGSKIRPGLKVLLTSGYAQSLLADGGPTRAWPTLGKPYHRDELLRWLQALLTGEQAAVGRTS